MSVIQKSFGRMMKSKILSSVQEIGISGPTGEKETNQICDYNRYSFLTPTLKVAILSKTYLQILHYHIPSFCLPIQIKDPPI